MAHAPIYVVMGYDPNSQSGDCWPVKVWEDRKSALSHREELNRNGTDSFFIKKVPFQPRDARVKLLTPSQM